MWIKWLPGGSRPVCYLLCVCLSLALRLRASICQCVCMCVYVSECARRHVCSFSGTVEWPWAFVLYVSADPTCSLWSRPLHDPGIPTDRTTWTQQQYQLCGGVGGISCLWAELQSCPRQVCQSQSKDGPERVCISKYFRATNHSDLQQNQHLTLWIIFRRNTLSLQKGSSTD